MIYRLGIYVLVWFLCLQYQRRIEDQEIWFARLGLSLLSTLQNSDNCHVLGEIHNLVCIWYMILLRIILSRTLHRQEVKEISLCLSVLGLSVWMIKLLGQKLERFSSDSLSLYSCKSGLPATWVMGNYSRHWRLPYLLEEHYSIHMVISAKSAQATAILNLLFVFDFLTSSFIPCESEFSWSFSAHCSY